MKKNILILLVFVATKCDSVKKDISAAVQENKEQISTDIDKDLNENELLKKIAQLLKSVEIDLINQTDNLGYTPLHRAVDKNNERGVQLLINAGANLNQEDKSGDTALHMAVANNNEKVVRLLINAGANLNQKNAYGHTALHIAVARNYQRVARLLIDAGANYGSGADHGYGKTPIVLDFNLPNMIIYS